MSHCCIDVLVGLLLAPEPGESAGAAISGGLTIAYPVSMVIGVRLLGRWLRPDSLIRNAAHMGTFAR